jgi:hypothetical protein
VSVTARILQAANLTVHDLVMQVTLEGSRGLGNYAHPDSDIDLTLIVDAARLPTHEPERADLLRAVLNTTLDHWRSPVDVDLAAVFDLGTCCGLRCFSQREWNDAIIRGRGVDCFGLYKVQRGFDGYVTSGVVLAKVYPILTIWRRGIIV